MILAAGCGGDGDNGGGGGGGGGGTVEASVNTGLLSKPALVNATYNTGQGRGVTTSIAVLRNFDMIDSFGVISKSLNPARRLDLGGYTSQTIDLSVPLALSQFSTNLNSRSFDEFLLNVKEIEFDGNVIGGSGQAPIINQAFPLRMRLFPGRTSSVQIFVDDAMITPDGSGGVLFDQALFEEVNFDPDENQIVSFVSDYLQFDISNVADKPTMISAGDADFVYFSGDSVGLSQGASPIPGSPFEVLVPLSPDPGVLEGLVTTPPSFPPNAPGTYTLRPIDPRSLPTTSRITALQGTWKPWYNPDNASQSPILNPGNFVFLTFPQSLNDQLQDLVMIALDGNGTITNMYFGEANLTNGTFSAWPISQVDDGDADNEISGTLNGYVFRPNIGTATPSDVRSGNFTVGSGTRPAEFPASGKFIVYRL